jgi:hypothetical protein
VEGLATGGRRKGYVGTSACRFGDLRMKRVVRFGLSHMRCAGELSIKGAAAGSGQSTSEKEGTNKDCPRKTRLSCGQRRLVMHTSREESGHQGMN